MDAIGSGLRSEAAALRYVPAGEPGLRRLRHGKGFRYVQPDGTTLRGRAERRRIEALAIPPAWTDVWICADPAGHVQAVGRDARGRKQYRYHPVWRAHRDATKYASLRELGARLPALRRKVRRDLRRPGLPREKVLAAVVRLLERTCIRVGNDPYCKQNRSFGLTTLRDRHVACCGAALEFQFRGKGGRQQQVALEDPRMARVVRRLQDLPGQRLFQYRDEQGALRPVGSSDVNAYLAQVLPAGATAKSFRTWAGSVRALEFLLEQEPPASERAAERTLIAAVDAVAGLLGNTRAVCRRFYVHPLVLHAYRAGRLPALAARVPHGRKDLARHEAMLLALLRARGARRRTARLALAS